MRRSTELVATLFIPALAEAPGKGCAELAADPLAPTLSLALPALPASTFALTRNLLLVPMGCAVRGHATDAATCGTDYTPSAPSATLALVATTPSPRADRLGLQALNALAGLPSATVKLDLGTDARTPLFLASGLGAGALGPRPAFTGLTRAALGALGGVSLLTMAAGNTTPTGTTPLTSALAASGTPEAALVDGAGFVLVAVGSAPTGATPPSFAQPLGYALVPAGP